MNRLRPIVLPLFTIVLALLGTGCDTAREFTFTGRLWNDTPISHYQPAGQPNVRMFVHRGDQDILVQYAETREKTGSNHERVYLLHANEDRVERMKKPRFLRLDSANGLLPIPVKESGATNLDAPIWAELTEKDDGFRVYRNGVATDWYRLPVYKDKRDEAERVLLTPVALTEDTAVAASILGVIAGLAYWQGGGCIGCNH
jgi:hypothetical protein